MSKDLELSHRRREGAIRYSRACKSDPHAFNRAMCHINNGIVGFSGSEKGLRHDMYDADTFPGYRDHDPRWDKLNELRTKWNMPAMREVDCTSYRNVTRP